ncbi:MAG: hypothetical protein JJU37_09775 [Balneolaceae bacterium]|nr:hypothetical protein [Balneolaceae bacterium]
MNTAQIQKLLLPNQFRYVGYSVLSLWFLYFLYEIINAVLGNQAPFVGDNFSSEKTLVWFSLVTYHFPIMGITLILVSKERIEDEFSLQIRMQAFILGLVATIVLSVLILLYALIVSPMQVFLSRFGLPTGLLFILTAYIWLKWRASGYEK